MCVRSRFLKPRASVFAPQLFMFRSAIPAPSAAAAPFSLCSTAAGTGDRASYIIKMKEIKRNKNKWST